MTPFVTYENRLDPHVAIHLSSCAQLRKRGGQHRHDQGRYVEHADYASAEAYAASTGLPVVNCSFCTPRSRG